MTAEEILKLIQDDKARQQVMEALQNEWVPKSDFTKATQAKAEEARKNEERALASEAEPWAAQVKAELANRQQAPANSNPGNPNGNWWENWDTFTPQQQAQVLQQEVSREQMAYAQQVAGQYGKAFQDAQTALGQQLQEQVGIYIDAFERRHKDPSLDIQPFLEKAKNFKTGNFNPMDAAYREVTYEKEKEKWLDEGRKHGRQEAETEFKAKRPEPNLINSGPEPFKPNTVKKEDRLNELKGKVTEKFGPQVWGP